MLHGARVFEGIGGLDIGLLFVTTALSAALSGALLLVARNGRGIDALAWWAIAMLLGSLGLLLLVLPLPQPLTLDFAKATLLLMVPASWTAARVFVGRRLACRAGDLRSRSWLMTSRSPWRCCWKHSFIRLAWQSFWSQ